MKSNYAFHYQSKTTYSLKVNTMAHEIDFSNNRANFAYVGQPAWHGLGTELPEGANVDQWRINAGFDWQAVKTPALYNVGGEVLTSDNEIIYRDDTKQPLGVVTDRYKIIQPAEVLAFYDDLTKEHGFKLETAGVLHGGKKLWALAKTGESFRIKGQDEVAAYLLLATSYDGKMATRAQFTSVRVVCQNTLNLSYNNTKDFVSVSHSTTFDPKQVKLNLGIFDDFQTNVELLADTGISDKNAVQFLLNIFEGENATVDDLSTRKANIIQDVYKRFDGGGQGSSYRSAKGTLWGVLNAVTEYVDHEQGRNQANRFNSSQWGQGAILKKAAYNKVMELALAA
jgi:phage/plasmid-like protein (TIGR03299 family)